jgi:hypothetical protein
LGKALSSEIASLSVAGAFEIPGGAAQRSRSKVGTAASASNVVCVVSPAGAQAASRAAIEAATLLRAKGLRSVASRGVQILTIAVTSIALAGSFAPRFVRSWSGFGSALRARIA